MLPLQYLVYLLIVFENNETRIHQTLTYISLRDLAPMVPWERYVRHLFHLERRKEGISGIYEERRKERISRIYEERRKERINRASGLHVDFGRLGRLLLLSKTFLKLRKELLLTFHFLHYSSCLNHFWPMFPFFIPRNYQETKSCTL